MSMRAVLLVGSARPRGQSTSEALGRHLLARLEAGGIQSEVRWVSHCRGEAGLAGLMAAIEEADLFLLATPLYVDALPHLVTAALEHIARVPRLSAAPRACRFVAIVNCGFPESAHTRVALDICRTFAAAAGLDFAGALGLGGGEVLGGRPPERVGWMARHVTRALDLTAESLLAGRPVPPRAIELMGRPMVPARGYTFFADMNWRKVARRNGVERLLEARPFESPPPRPAAG